MAKPILIIRIKSSQDVDLDDMYNKLSSRISDYHIIITYDRPEWSLEFDILETKNQNANG